jgi:signal transduction histidine kinase
MKRNCLVLTQFRESSEYNDFIGRFYHFPNKCLSQFNNLPAEFIYYEPTKGGEGVYFGYGKIKNAPTKDKRESGHYFIEVSDYKPFTDPVSFKDMTGKLREANSSHYNPQNAVRKISAGLLDEICLDGKIRLNFQVDAHLVKVLGEQLIASEKVGILELIKNAYDAGATNCTVTIENIPSLPVADKNKYLFPELQGPVIVIEDDGIGMTRDVIENGWLRPASTIKTNIKLRIREEREKSLKRKTWGAYKALIAELKKEYKNRIPLGEKGVGRFATHRLGKKLIVKTKIKELNYEYVLQIDWDAFDNALDKKADLESIGVTLTRQQPSRNYGPKGSGTQLIIYGGKDGFTWDESIIKDINKSVLSLNSPNPRPGEIKNTFEATLNVPQIKNLLKAQIYTRFTPTFSFDAFVNEEGVMETYSIKFCPPKSIPLPSEKIPGKKFDLKLAEKAYWTKSNGLRRNPECGAFYMHIDAWYRKKPWIDGPDSDLMMQYLDEYGGIAIYRDNVLIFPAESGSKDDWLNLSTRHIKKGERVSYYAMIGNIEIKQTENINLIDKTDREGMIENVPFKDLAKLVESAIVHPLETTYMAKRDAYTKLTAGIIQDPKTLSQVTKQSSQILDNLVENYSMDDPLNLLKVIGGKTKERKQKLINLSDSLKNLKKSVDLMDEAQELLTEKAGYGLAVAISVHEIAKITANFYMGVSQLLKAEKISRVKLEDLKDASESLQSELRRLSPLRAVRNESPTEFNLKKSINFAQEIFKSKLRDLGIKLEIKGRGDFRIYARYGTLNQVFANLIDNSIYWIDTANTKEKKIIIVIDPQYRTVTVADSGVGVDDAMLPYLFQPGYSRKIPPSGLGLYVCKHYMQAMNGDIYITNSRERVHGIKGAQFTLDFGKTPKNQEEHQV